MKQLEPSLPNSRAIVFGPFRLSPKDRAVYAGGQRVAIGEKAYQILLLLVSHPEEVIPAERFNQQLWPNTPSDDINLRVQIASLRKALGQFEGGDWNIQNVSGRGYRFAGKALYEESFVGSIDPALPNRTSGDGREGPVHLEAFSDKESDIKTVTRLIATGPVTTITGAGGVGKTVVALQAMRNWCSAHAMDAVFVDLSAISSPSHVQSALISALTPPLPENATSDAVIDLLRGKRLLVVLDSCEHAIDAAASLANMLARTSDARVLTTSREPLRIEGESVHRVLPLPFSLSTEGHGQVEPKAFAAVQLFRDLARAAGSPLPSDSATSLQLARLCALLDGLPLAIEFAAASLNVFNLAELTERLIANPLHVLSRGRRTVAVRHQSIRASIDWSYDTLTGHEQRLFRDISIFDGPFTLAYAHALFGNAHDDLERDTQAVLLSLIDKSLVTVGQEDGRTTFSIPNLIRSHGTGKLIEHEELDEVRSRFVEFAIRALTEPTRYSSVDAETHSVASESIMLAQVRNAFDWLLTMNATESHAFTLAWASYDLHIFYGRLDEYRRLLEQLVARLPDTTVAADDAFRLHLALGRIALMGLPAQNDLARRALATAISLAQRYDCAERIDEATYHAVRAELAFGDYRHARALTSTLRRTASSAGLESDFYQESMAMLQLKRGNVRAASKHLKKIKLSARTNSAIRESAGRSLATAVTPVKICEAQMLWLTGHSSDANSLLRELNMQARLASNEYVCEVLAEGSCLIACWSGDIPGLEQRHRELVASISTTGAERWTLVARCFALCLNGATFDPSLPIWTDIDKYEPAVHDLFATVNRSFLTSQSVDRARTGKAGCCTPEILRSFGEHLLRRGSSSCAESETLFSDALALSRRQGLVAWELRASISLAKLRRRAQRSSEAIDILSEALDKLPDLADSADSKLARALISEMSTADEERNSRDWL